MNKIWFTFACYICIFSVSAQVARNPLNLEPSQVALFLKPSSSARLTEVNYYRADGTPLERSLYTYSADGRKAATLNRSWDASVDEWINISSKTYLYSKDQTEIIASEWDVSGKETPTSSTVVYKDAQGRKSYSLKREWNSRINDFEAVAIRNEWRYDANGRLSEYGKNIGAERNAARISYLYDEKGNLTQELYLSRSKNGWREAGKYTYSANESVSMYYAADRWITDVIVKTSYDIDDKLVRTDYYSADGSQLQAYCTYSYDDARSVATLTDIINVYPNPVIDECVVNVPENLIGRTISLFDSFGKHVITTLASNNATTINTTSLPSGIYYLKIGNLTGKVIKK